MGNRNFKSSGSAEPIIELLRRDEEWITNQELANALGFAGSAKSVVGHWPDALREIGSNDTKLVRLDSIVGAGRPVRVFSKKATVQIALRGRTANARAFQQWLTARALDQEVWNG